MIENGSNWAGNYTYSAARLHHPETVEQVQELVSRASSVKALGSRHSFNSIADSPGELISLDCLDPSGYSAYILALDRERRTVIVAAGVRYGQLARQLYLGGLALHNLASLPHISIAGACATATHGSGDGNGNLATTVSGVELITASGEVVELFRDGQGERDAQFAGLVVNLGAVGIVTKLTLDIVPAFEMRQDVYENLPYSQLEEHFDDITSRAYSVSMFTDWQNETVNMVWLKRRIEGVGAGFELEPTLYGASLAAVPRHPIPGLSAEAITEQLGVAGPWYERLPHFRMDFTPSSSEELQTEYLVPRPYALAAFRAVHSLRDRIAPLVQVSEIRTVAADNLWMSPCYRQDCVGIHFTWQKNWRAVSRLLPLIEEALAPLEARPHWGKLFTMSPERVRSLYHRLPDFQRLVHSYDAQGKFRNTFLDAYIFGSNEH